MRFFSVFIGMVLLFSPCLALGDKAAALKNLGGPFLAEDHELPFLPPYCRYCASVSRDKYKHEKEKWKKLAFDKGNPTGLHHYCYGLTMLHRFNVKDGNPKALLKKAEGEFGYVLKHSNPQGNVLYPQVLLKMGIVQKHKGNENAAVGYFIRAIKIKRNYAQAYFYIIEYFQSIGDVKTAYKYTKKGLKYSPNSKALRKKEMELKSIGG